MSTPIFNSVQVQSIDSNYFDLTHDVKMSLQMGKLYPCLTMECLPGDKVTLAAESLIRFAPLVTPVMHRFDVYIHYFFVPYRLLWEPWDKWITGDVTVGGMPTTTINLAQDDIKSLGNYLGMPASIANRTVTALPYAAYQFIYNEYYRDQNLIPEVPYKLVAGDNTANTDLKILRRRAWEHDYFTSALPFAQAGAPVNVPLGDVNLKANWASNPVYPVFQTALPSTELFDLHGNNNTGSGQFGQYYGGPGTGYISTNTEPSAYDPRGSLEVGQTTVNELRRAYKLQEYLERLARGGKRITEFIKSMWNVNSPDARLQRPEYITGTKSPVVISEVLNTSGSALPQGNMAGHGVSVVSGNAGTYYCQEYGYIMGIMSVMPKTAYQQGIPKQFLKTDPLDFANPIFANLGEQEIKNKEVYTDHTNPEGTFGYIPRFAEYKFMSNRVAGDFQNTLEDWHLARIFATDPNLNQAFIECDPSRRIFAVTNPTDDVIYAQVLNKIGAVRKLPVYGTPSMF